MPNSIKPCHIDGILFCAIAFFGACATMFATDDAAKYIQPSTLWWTKNFCSILSASALALKMYRSTSYAQYRDVENKKMVKKQDIQDAKDALVDSTVQQTTITTIEKNKI